MPANKTTAIVGPSGSGKSTVIGLIERWFTPESGTITVDGHKIEDCNIQWVRTNIRLVQQASSPWPRHPTLPPPFFANPDHAGAGPLCRNHL